MPTGRRAGHLQIFKLINWFIDLVYFYAMKSMTGYGKAVCELPQKKVTIEIRSLNSRQLDLGMRVHMSYREKEAELRSELSRSIERGKVDFSIYAEYTGDAGMVSLNTPLALNYHNVLKTLAEKIGEEKNAEYLPIIVKMPDVLKQEKQELDESEWKLVQQSVQDAIKAFNAFREDEGKTLFKEFEQRIGIILAKLAEILTLDPQRVAGIRERIGKNLEEFIAAEKIDRNRFEQELIFYIEKLDITEEKLRLQTHCDYFMKTMQEPSSGRKLGFISQEIGREINTIGSKSNDAGIQRLVVEMKDELEKIKEQLLNVL
ncbi:MAG: hypothetical protein FD123_2163 [Bacteroidetes bacterium]|nr:MAG: hypothetical protein FD123_2163 [Bacteroidota bacterium]